MSNRNPNWAVLALFLLILFFQSCTSHTPAGDRPEYLGEISPSDLEKINSILIGLSANNEVKQSLNRSLFDRKSPLWPIQTYVLGKVLVENGRKTEAKAVFKSLVTWACSDPFRDGWGGASLAYVGLWQWLKLVQLDEKLEKNEIYELKECAFKLKNTKLQDGMVRPSILSTIPKLEVDIQRRLTVLMWKSAVTREEKDEARNSFLEFLAMTDASDLTSIEEEIYLSFKKVRNADMERLSLYRAEQLVENKRGDQAIVMLENLIRSRDSDVKSNAAYFLARVKRQSGQISRTRGSVISLLDLAIDHATDAKLIQKALYLRAITKNRPGPGQNTKGFLEDLQFIVSKFPLGDLTDDALLGMARYYQTLGDFDKSLGLYEQLIGIRSKNDWSNLSRFNPAIILLCREGEDDLNKAERILNNLLEKDPFGPLSLAAQFWLGRIAEKQGRDKEASQCFRKVIATCPYDYYAIRAHMHLLLGREAAQKIQPGFEIKDRIAKEFKQQKTPAGTFEDSPYIKRLLAAITSGIYQNGHRAILDFRKSHPSVRIEAMCPGDIEKSGNLTQIAILLSLRQDAIAARDFFPNPENTIGIASLMRDLGKDIPLSLIIIKGFSQPLETRMVVQRSKGYLALAYPSKFTSPDLIESIRKASTKYQIMPEIVYAIIKNESLFEVTALSESNALGLFQFVPATFNALDRKWNVLASKGAPSREALLMDPTMTIDLGARYFKEELMSNQNGDVFFSVLEHNAGFPATKEWKEKWQDMKILGDYEMMIENIPFMETRRFARYVLTDIFIASSLELFQGAVR